MPRPHSPTRPRNAFFLCLCAVLFAAAFAQPAALAQQIIRVNAAAAPGGDGQSWATAFNDLHDALAAAAAIPEPRDVQVWVAQGTYYTDPSNGGDRDRAFMIPSACSVLGGFDGTETNPTGRAPWPANQTTLNGATGAGVGARVLARITTGSAGRAFERLRFINANSGGTGVLETGEGAVVVSGAGAGFKRCEFESNRGTLGAAAAPDVGPGDLRFTDCIFDSNIGIGNAPIISGTGTVMIRCDFRYNISYNGPLLQSFALIEQSRFIYNSGYGPQCFGAGSDINLSTFTGNTCPSPNLGTFSPVFASVSNMQRTLFADNESNSGPSDIDLVIGTLRHSTVVLRGSSGNTLPGGRLAVSQILNSVVSSPITCSPPSADCAVVPETGFPSTIYAEHSFVQALPFQSAIPSPVNCITGDPLLDNTIGYRPMPGSPLIDAGCDNSGGFVDEYDFDNDGDTSEIIHVDLYGSPRLIDDPFRTDTGCAPFPQPNADIGYAEHVPVCPDLISNCPGIVRDWLRPLSGAFDDAANWIIGVPTSTSPARFRVDGNFSIDFASNRQASSLEVADGNIAFNLNGRTFDLISTVGSSLRVGGNDVGGAASLSVSGGVLSAKSARIADALGSTGDVIITGPGTRLAMPLGAMTVGSQGTGSLSILNGATATTQILTVGEFPGSSGSVTVSGAGSRLLPKFGLNIFSGTVRVESGGLIDLGTTGDVVLLQGATITGDGTLRSDVTNFGTINPAPPTAPAAGTTPFATLTINGDYQQVGIDPKAGAFSGRLAIDVGATGTASDRLQVSGSVSLAGGLFISLPPGTDPPVSTAWQPIAATGGFPTKPGGRPNQFDVAFFPGLPGRIMTLTYPAPFERGGSVTVGVSAFDVPPNFSENNYTFGGEPTGAVLRDFDGDTDIDLAVTIPDSNPALNGVVVLLLNAGNAPGGAWNGYVVQQQTITVGRFPAGIDSADLDADGDRDIVVVNRDDNSVQILSNGGAAAFSPLAAFASGGTAPTEVIAARLDAGATFDLAVVNQGSDHARVFSNSGPAAFALQPYALQTGDGPVDLVALDLDGDTDNDLVTADADSNELSLFLLGPPVSPGSNPYLPRRILPVDVRPTQIEPGGLDNPKDLEDLAVVCSGTGPGDPGSVSILRNIINETSAAPDDSAAVFAPAVNLPVGSVPRSLAILDLDSDGPNFDADIAVVVDGASPGTTVVRFLRNDTNGGQQLGFALAGDVPGSPSNAVLVRAADIGGSTAADLVTINSDTSPLPPPGSDRSADATPRVDPSRGTPDKVRVLTNARPGTPVPCPTDLNGDRLINTFDLTILLGTFGQTVSPPGSGGDVNGDGQVNTVDLVALLATFGTNCP